LSPTKTTASFGNLLYLFFISGLQIMKKRLFTK
jgi:hypothetical protein